MKSRIMGKALVLGDDVNTDVLQPSRYYSLDESTRASGVLANSHPREVAGTIIVAGENFGVGSSRESVIRGLLEAGVLGITARSVSRIFLRNAINQGLPVFSGLGDARAVQDGDEVSLDLRSNLFVCESRALSLPVDSLDPYLSAVLEAGGLMKCLGLK